MYRRLVAFRAAIKTSEVEEQSALIKYCVKLWKNVAKNFETVKTTFYDGFLNRASMFERAVIQGRNSVDDDPRSG